MADPKKFQDIAAERTVINTILKKGRDAFIDLDTIVGPNDFQLGINRIVYGTMKHVFDSTPAEKCDIDTIVLKGTQIGYADFFNDKTNIEYLKTIDGLKTTTENPKLFGIQVKKCAVLNGLYQNYNSIVSYIEQLKGSEPISEILGRCEQLIDEYNYSIQTGDMEVVGSDIEEMIATLLETPCVDQVGIPTGFKIWDNAIGGGVRKGTINVIGARPKSGKSFMALNMARNIAEKGIPVLYLDSELTKHMIQSRLVPIVSGCPIREFETGRVQKNMALAKRVIESGKHIATWPLTYANISGQNTEEILSVIRRWIIKEVGFAEDGQANDCVVVYDYLKLTSGNGLGNNTPETILIGLIMTQMHNFAIKYKIPIITFCQLNREGIDSDDTNAIASSDRILWLCSSLSILRNKNHIDTEIGSDMTMGNKKLKVIETRHGAGMDDIDYINIRSSLRPTETEDTATGLMTEGFKNSQCIQERANIK